MENDAAPDTAIKDQFDWCEDATMQLTTQKDGKAAEEDKGGSRKRKRAKPPTAAAKISKRTVVFASTCRTKQQARP
eukprot:8061236-Ditylum_brightwellii.AAC.1